MPRRFVLVAFWGIPDQFLNLGQLGDLTDKNFRYTLVIYKKHTAALNKIRALTYKTFTAPNLDILYERQQVLKY